MKRSRWAAFGAVIAVTLGSGGLMSASADVASGDRPVLINITPCRVADTRPGSDNVGPRSTPLGAAETYTLTIRGTNGNCTIPTDAVAIVLNVAAIFPTASSFFTLYPADAAARPLSANLNFLGGQAPVSNGASIKLSADGKMSIFNLAGTVHFTIDILGYYVGHNHNDLYYTKAELDARQWTSANIADGTIATADLADNSVTSAKIPDFNATGGLTNNDIGVFYAVVTGTAVGVTVNRSSGVGGVAVTATRVGTGNYQLDFKGPIDQCAWTATSEGFGFNDTDAVAPPPATNINLLRVHMHTHDGTLYDGKVHVTVVC